MLLWLQSLRLGVGFVDCVIKVMDYARHDYMAKTAVIEGRAPFRGSQAVAIALLASAGVFVSYRITAAFHQEKPSLDVAENENFIERVTKQVAAVGTIYTYGKTGAAIAQGSAFVLNSAGLAATNVHVLEGAFRADCRLGDGRLFNVLAVQGFDASEDVALFQLGRTINDRVELPSSLTFVKIGSSAGVKVGDRVVTISSPKGLSNTISDRSCQQHSRRRRTALYSDDCTNFEWIVWLSAVQHERRGHRAYNNAGAGGPKPEFCGPN